MESKLQIDAFAFLAETEWRNAAVLPLTQDASARQYYRLDDEAKGSAILMDASSAPDGEMGRFLAAGAHLRTTGLSAPQIFAQAPGYLVLEDYGDARFADLPIEQGRLYHLAMDVLLHLQSFAAPTNLPECDPSHLGMLAATAWLWYPSSAAGKPSDVSDNVEKTAREIAEELDLTPRCMILRDYHAENLMWLPDRKGVERAGLLDFQDAMIGEPVFDVVSLLQDARRDIDPAFEHEMCRYFQREAQMPKDEFSARYAALGAMRNLRIVGMFARLSRHLGRPGYVDFIPRVWRYLEQDLEHPALWKLKKLVSETLPYPTKAHLEFLRNACLNPPPQ